MRRSVKIQSYFILLAWSFMFLHNIIPHNHLNNNISGCHELVHNTSSEKHHCEGVSEYKELPEEITVCHISGFLFHQLNTDNLLLAKFTFNNFEPVLNTVCKVTPVADTHVSDPYYGTFSLRAPPEA